MSDYSEAKEKIIEALKSVFEENLKKLHYPYSIKLVAEVSSLIEENLIAEEFPRKEKEELQIILMSNKTRRQIPEHIKSIVAYKDYLFSGQDASISKTAEVYSLNKESIQTVRVLYEMAEGKIPLTEEIYRSTQARRYEDAGSTVEIRTSDERKELLKAFDVKNQMDRMMKERNYCFSFEKRGKYEHLNPSHTEQAMGTRYPRLILREIVKYLEAGTSSDIT